MIIFYSRQALLIDPRWSENDVCGITLHNNEYAMALKANLIEFRIVSLITPASLITQFYGNSSVAERIKPHWEILRTE